MVLPLKTDRSISQTAEIGSHLTARLSLPHTPREQQHEVSLSNESIPSPLSLSSTPLMQNLTPVINTLGSVEIMMCLQRLSHDELAQLYALGAAQRNHPPPSTSDQAQLIERLAESLFLTQSKSITTLNTVGPERWRGVIKTPDAVVGVSYRSLPEEALEVARANVFRLARSLTTLPEEGISLINDFRSLRPGIASWVDPLHCLHDRVLKRAIHCNFDAWQLRKRLENSTHAHATQSLESVPANDRLFASLMGIATFQLLREAGQDSCKALLRTGRELLKLSDLSAANFQLSIQSNDIMTGVRGPDRSHIGVSFDLMLHLARNHHELWLANRNLCSLLPEELHQPHRTEHRPFDELPRHIQNLSCLHILCLAASLAEASQTESKSQLISDLLRTAAPGNPFTLSI